MNPAQTPESQGVAPRGQSLEILQKQEQAATLRISDLRVQIEQLREQQQLHMMGDQTPYLKPFADAQHQLTVAGLEYETVHAKISALQAATTVQPHGIGPFLEREGEKIGVGIFLLIIPIVVALARRIWVRSGRAATAVGDLESSTRLRRLEQTVEAMSLDLERVGEAQRFAVELLEQRLDPAPLRRSLPADQSASAPRREGVHVINE